MIAASVLVPTHDAAATLDLAVESALAQTVRDLEVVIIGDGVTPEVREVVERLVQADSRVRFLDRPKGEHHGERYRDEAIRATAAPVVCYLCDDDLLFPHHVEQMLALLEDADLVQCANGHLEPDGTFVPYASDLASEPFRRWLQHPARNSVSVTGTAHTVASYLRIPVGWEPPPPGRWTDHVMWQKFLALDGLRAATSDEVTALQLPTHLSGRAGWSPEQRRAELQRWSAVLADPVERAALQRRLNGAYHRGAAWLRTELDAHAEALADLRQAHEGLAAHAAALERDRDDLAQRLASTEAERAALAAALALVEGSRTWRLRSRLVRGPIRRLVRR